MDKKLTIERLTQLADFLEALPPKKFDYSVWTRGGELTPDGSLGCDTTGCAMGWAVTLPFAKEAGYAYVPNLTCTALNLRREGGISQYGVAGAELFGLGEADFEVLFMLLSEDGVPAKEVAAAIRIWCAKYENSSYLSAEDGEKVAIFSAKDIFPAKYFEGDY